MDALQKTRLKLLTHSKNMLNASEQEDWQRYAELDSVWHEMLQAASDKFGNDLLDLGSELMADNDAIQKNIAAAQQQLLNQLEQDSQNTSQIKSYLK